MYYVISQYKEIINWLGCNTFAPVNTQPLAVLIGHDNVKKGARGLFSPYLVIYIKG